MEKQITKTTPNQKPSFKKETKSEEFERQKKNMIVIYITSLILLIIFIGIIKLCARDDLENLTNSYIFNITGWNILHLVLYTLLGYFAHTLWIIIIIIGVLFECLEIIVNSLITKIGYDIIGDTIVNIFGLLFGIILYKIIPNKINLYKLVLSIFK